MSRDPLPIVVVDGVAMVDLPQGLHASELSLLLVRSRERAFADPAVRRLEVRVAATDRAARHALHQADFRLEGVHRSRHGEGVDEHHYAVLRTDSLGSRHARTSVLNTITARKRVIAHLLLTAADGAVCVLETTFKPDFELPGGILEVGESPREGLAREVAEELDHQLTIGRLLVVDWLAPHLGWEDAVELIFDAGVCPDRSLLHPDGQEIRAVHWLDEATAIQTMAPFAQGRLRAALAARSSDRTFYLEAGQQIS